MSQKGARLHKSPTAADVTARSTRTLSACRAVNPPTEFPAPLANMRARQQGRQAGGRLARNGAASYACACLDDSACTLTSPCQVYCVVLIARAMPSHTAGMRRRGEVPGVRGRHPGGGFRTTRRGTTSEGHSYFIPPCTSEWNNGNSLSSVHCGASASLLRTVLFFSFLTTLHNDDDYLYREVPLKFTTCEPVPSRPTPTPPPSQSNK